MAWDTEKTKSRILEAALLEFSEKGPAGTTIDNVARRSGVNKERIYHYFGNKQALFGVVLDRNTQIQEGKIGMCDIRAGRRPEGEALERFVAEYQSRAGTTVMTGNDLAQGDVEESEDDA